MIFLYNALVMLLLHSLLGQYILFSGWVQDLNMHYLGALRATSTIYFLCKCLFHIALLNVTLFSSIIEIYLKFTFNQVYWRGLIYLHFIVLLYFFFIAVMAENNRPPFDFTWSRRRTCCWLSCWVYFFTICSLLY